MRSKRYFLALALLLYVVLISSCATTPPPPLAFPQNSDAKKYYDSGEQNLLTGHYEKAVENFDKSLQIEPEPFSTRVRLAIAYYAQKKFSEAAKEFELVYMSFGGPREGAGFALLYAFTLRKAGKTEQAEKLLESWSSPDIQSTGTSWINVGSGKLPGWSKSVAKYLLGDVTEEEVLKTAPANLISYAIMYFGLENNHRGNIEKANEYLQAVLNSVGPHTWRFALAKIEIESIEM